MTSAAVRRASRRRNTADATGTVRVQIVLVGPRGQHTRGNIVRSFTFSQTTVSTVAGKVEGVR